jgi:hypothetical protein
MSKKRTTAEFIIEAKKVHGDKYDYSKTVYVGSQEKVCITCPKHGDYFIIAEGHLRGAGCPQCHNLSKRSNKESFIAKCREVYGDLYDYSKVEYIHSKEKVCVICPKHGEFWVTPNNHMRGSRCPACYGTPRKTTEQFIKEAKKIHGNKYDYSKVKYDGTDVKVCIVCPEHGEFWQTPYSHLKGCQCPVCSKVQRITQDIFIKRCTEIHHGRYDYSKVNFEHVKKKVCIICPEHGDYWQKAGIHLRGYGCPICGGSQQLTTEKFIEKAKLVHGHKYDYSKTNYINYRTKVCIICPEHGEFWQVPNNHLFGAGCPTCPESNMEGEIRQLLLNKGIIFEQEKGFDWLVYNRRMFLDFFLPEYGVAIECQGKQHFSPTEIFGGEEFYKMTVERDKVKKRLCEEHGIRVLYYSRSHIEYPYPVFESMRQLLKAIKDKGIVVDNQRWRNLQLELEFED